MSIADRIQAINDHLIDDYKVLRLAGADLSGVNKNIVNLKMSWKERLLYFMNNGTQEVWDNWDKVNGSGETVSLSNTEEAPMSLAYKGNTYQYQKDAENYFNPTNIRDSEYISNPQYFRPIAETGTTSGTLVSNENVTVSWNNTTKKFSISGSWASTSTSFLSVLKLGEIPAGTYTLTLSTGAIRYAELKTESVGGTTLCSISRNGTSATFTISEPTVAYLGFNFSTGTFDVEYSFNLTDGIVMPSPDYPSPVQVVSGDNAITVTNSDNTQSASYPISLGDKELCKIGTYQDKIDKSTGRNLCGYDNTLPYTNGGVTLERENGYYKTSGTTSTVWFYKNVYTIPAGTLNGTYRVKKFLYSGTNEAQIRVIDRTVSPAVTYVETKDSNTFTISNNNTLNVEISVRLNYASNEKFNFILQDANETNLEYEPYGTGWYLKKEIGKVVLNGSENWQLRADVSISTGFYTYQNLDYVAGVFNTNSIGFSNNFEIVTGGNNSKNNIRLVNSANYGTQICITGEIAQTAVQLKSWLSTHNTEVYYIRITPTYDKITDTTLISQLEAMKQSYDSQTNISQTNNDLPFELDVVALSNGTVSTLGFSLGNPLSSSQPEEEEPAEEPEVDSEESL